MAERILKSIEEIKATWGDEFAPLANDNRIQFTESEIILKLKSKITTEEGELSEIRLREPTVQDLKKIDEAKGDIAKAAALFSSCAGILPVYVNKVKGRDFLAAQKVIAAFLADGPQIGGL